MTTTTDPGAIDLKPLKVLCDAAHEGPWKSRGMGGDSYVLMPTHRWHCKIYQFDAFPLAIPRPYQDMEGKNAVDYASAGFAHDDAKFVAEARTAMPTLIAAVEALRDDLADLEALRAEDHAAIRQTILEKEAAEARVVELAGQLEIMRDHFCHGHCPENAVAADHWDECNRASVILAAQSILSVCQANESDSQ